MNSETSQPLKQTPAGVNPWLVAVTVTMATFMEVLDSMTCASSRPQIRIYRRTWPSTNSAPHTTNNLTQAARILGISRDPRPGLLHWEFPSTGPHLWTSNKWHKNRVSFDDVFKSWQ